MSINIYTVQNHLKEEGWKLLSSSYKNLNTELEMECPEGHKQSQTYGNWRKRPICEQCIAGDPYKIKRGKIPAKKIDTTRILALDAATIITGYALYDDNDLIGYGTYKVNKDLPTDERINEMKKWLEAAIDEWRPNSVFLENIQLQSYGEKDNQFQVQTYKVLAQLQGVLLDTLYEKEIPYDLAYAVEWRKYCGVGEGKGRENKKKQAQNKVKVWYGIDCTQDEADAICLGKYFCHYRKGRTFSWGDNI